MAKLESFAAPTLRALPLWSKNIQPLHGKLESNVFLFFLFLFNLLLQTHRGRLQYFFLLWVCFSKVSLEVLPIWLRKTGAPVTNCVHSPLCGLETFPTYRCYKKLLMFFQGPTVCSSATGKEDRAMGEVLFVLQDESRQKSFQHSIRGTFLPLPTPPPSFWHLGPQAGFHSPPLWPSSPSNLKIKQKLFLKIRFPTIALKLLWERV